MKIRRFTGVDMRDVLRQVRNALGADAVILETAHKATSNSNSPNRPCNSRFDSVFSDIGE